MTHREQLIAMLDDAGIEYGQCNGDSINVMGCIFRFSINGRLNDAEPDMSDD